MTPRFWLVVASLGLAACGGRTGLDLPTWAAGDEAAGGGAGAGGGTAGGAGGAGGKSVLDQDICPSAISGPQAMVGSCSTRDGRARVPAPAHPHLTWMAQLPVPDSELGESAIVTGGAGEAYVVTTENFADKGVIRRIRVADGGVDWTLPLTPDSATTTPLILATGKVDLFAYDVASKPSLLAIDGLTGTPQATTFGFDLYASASAPAVGEEGSLYLLHDENVGTANSASFLSRVAPGGAVTWTTPDLLALAASAGLPGAFSPSFVALGAGGLVVTVIEQSSVMGQKLLVLGLDAATGAVRWQTTLPGQLLGGPAIGGRVALLVGPADATDLALLDPATGAPAVAALHEGVTEIFALTQAGAILAGTNAGKGIDGLALIDETGHFIWTNPGAVRHAVIASDGTIVAVGATVRALDAATGAVRWELVPPAPGSCLFDAALTSDGGLIGLQCNGIVFGARD